MHFNKPSLMNILVTMSFNRFFLFSYPLGLIFSAPFLNQASTVESATSWFFLKCPLHYLTGWMCPTCGMTRSFVAIIRGEWVSAFEYQPFGPFLFIFLFLYWLLLVFNFDVIIWAKKQYLSHSYVRHPLRLLALGFIAWGFSRNF